MYAITATRRQARLGRVFIAIAVVLKILLARHPFYMSPEVAERELSAIAFSRELGTSTSMWRRE
jgi:hypothetical protein